MPKVWSKAKIKGKSGEVIIDSLLNSGADYVVLSPEIVEKIEPEIVAHNVEVQTAAGESFLSDLYVVEIEIENPETHEIRHAQTEAIVLPGRSYPLLGVSIMEKLRIIANTTEGKIEFR